MTLETTESSDTPQWLLGMLGCHGLIPSAGSPSRGGGGGGLHRGERVALVATGALTNVALLLILYPEVTAMVDITLMGGAMGMGNTGPVQEFNIQAKFPTPHRNAT